MEEEEKKELEKKEDNAISYTDKANKKVAIISTNKKKPVKYFKILKDKPLPLGDGYYFYYPLQNRYISLSPRVSIYGDYEYAYRGLLEEGQCELLLIENGKRNSLPLKGSYDYGYTLEGDAKALFHVSDCLLSYSAKEGRSFAYINPNSKLYFCGAKGLYSLSFRLFGERNNEGKRWVVIYLSR